MRRFFTFLLLLVACLAALFYFAPFRSGQYRPLQAVPANAIYLVETDEPLQAWRAISGSGAWQYLRRQPYFAQLARNAEHLSQLLADNPQLFDLIGSQTVLASAHMVRLNDYDFLFVVDLGKMGQLSFLETILARLPLGNYTVSQAEYKSYRINQLFDKKTNETLHWAVVDNLLLCSYHRSLIDAAIDQKDQPHLANDPVFAQVSTRTSNSGLFKLYVQYPKVADFSRAYMPQPNDFVQMLARDLAFSGLSFEAEDDGLLLLQGHTNLNDSLASYFKAALQAGRGNLSVQDVLPQRTAYYMSLAFNNFPTFYNNAEAIYQQDVAAWNDYQKNLKQIEKLLKINVKENFVSWIGEEVALVQSQPLGLARSDELAVVFKVADLDRAKQNLDFITEQVRRRTPAKFIEIDYKGYSIHYLTLNNFFKFLLGNVFARLEKPYFTIIDEFVVFSNHPQTLKGIIDDYEAGQTLGKSAAFRDFFDQFNPSSNIFMYAQTPVMHGALRGMVSPATWAEMQQNRAYITCFPQVGFQWNGNGDLLDTKIACQFDSTAASPPPPVVVQPAPTPDTLATSPEGDDAPLDIAIDDLTTEKQEQFYPNGTKKLEVSVRDGFRHGRYLEYHPNGRIKVRGNYRNDKQDGLWRYFDQNGNQTHKRKFRNGEEVEADGIF